MEITTFADDLLGLNDFADRLEKFIEVEHQFVQGSLVIALSSKFGTGKTTFFKMWKARFESNEHKGPKPLIISLSAWESDYYGDPLFAIVSALVEATKENKNDANTTKNLIEAAKDVGWYALAITGQVAKKYTGVDATAAGDFAQKKKTERKKVANPPMDAFSIYEGRKNAMAALKAAIKKYVADSEPRVLFLIDELDRCRPDYAISYLETIKHIFDMQGAVFILAADRKHLENSAKTAFGPDLDFEEYYRKFIHREVSLPDITKESYVRIASTYVPYYLEKSGVRSCFLAFDQARLKNIIELVSALKLTPRQIQEVFRILGHLLETSETNKGSLLWGYGAGSIAMAAFKVADSKAYQQFGNATYEPKLALDFLESLLPQTSSSWWFVVLLTGGALLNKSDSHEQILQRLSSPNNGLQKRLDYYGQYSHGWGESEDGIKDTYQKIENLSRWG